MAIAQRGPGSCGTRGEMDLQCGVQSQYGSSNTLNSCFDSAENQVENVLRGAVATWRDSRHTPRAMGVVPMPWQGTEIRPRLLRDLPPTPFVSDSPDDHDALRVLIGRPTVLFSASWYERWDTLLYGTRSGLEKKDNQLAVVPARSKGRESHSIALPCPGRALMNIQSEGWDSQSPDVLRIWAAKTSAHTVTGSGLLRSAALAGGAQHSVGPRSVLRTSELS